MDTCEHDWVKRVEYSSWPIQRFKCSKCGRWAHKQFGRKFKGIVPYDADGEPVFEPRPEWQNNTEPPKTDWSDVGARNPDRTNADDDSSDYKPPRRY